MGHIRELAVRITSHSWVDSTSTSGTWGQYSPLDYCPQLHLHDAIPLLAVFPVSVSGSLFTSLDPNLSIVDEYTAPDSSFAPQLYPSPRGFDADQRPKQGTTS